MEKRKKYLAVSFAVVLVAAAVVSIVGMALAGREPMILQGQVEATQIRISGKLPGRIDRFLVAEGQNVRRGDTLVVINSPEAWAKYDQVNALENVAVIPSADLALYDFIHNAAEGNLVVGERCARAALAMCYGRETDWMAPEPESARKTAPDTVELRFSRVRNWLNPFDVPAALLPIEAEDANGLAAPVSYKTGRDTLTITFDRQLGEGARLHGAWRMNPGAAIPGDCMRLPMLSFYGFPIE